MWDSLWTVPHLWTGVPGSRVIADAAVGVRDGRIVYLGPANGLSDQPASLARELHRCDGGLIGPGLIDCHTHLVFAGNRAEEFERRLAGVSYAEIAAAGGGIAHSVRASRAASADELYTLARPRARQAIADGVTAIEIKGGYGLDLASERKLLQVARRLGRSLGITVRTSYLALHALPHDASSREAYLDAAIDQWLPSLHEEGLIDAVDAYHESIAFSSEEVTRLFDAATRLGLPVKLHADQLSAMGGAALAAQHAALSADHLEYTDAAGVQAMARAGTVAVLLPGAYLVLKEKQLPPIALLREAGVPMAIATDLNPGTSPLLSLRTAMSLAISLFGLRVDEALAGASVHAARALGLQGEHGQLLPGGRADFVWWNAQSPAELVYWIGGSLARTVVAAGNVILQQPEDRSG